ncbi:MAG: restriction endonuclease subunit S [Flavobacterium sp.]
MRTEKFKNLFWFGPKSNIKAGDGLDKGRFPFYTSSPKLTKWIDKEQHFDEALIFGTGGLASVHFEDQPFSTSTDCIVAITTNKEIKTKFVYYYLFGNIHLLERGFKGAGLKHISKKYIENLDIPVLPIETQNKIVAILDNANSIIEKRQRTIKIFADLLRASFLDMFGDPISNTKNWNIELLVDIAKLERGRFSPRPRNDPSYFGGEYPFIQTGDINNSRYRLKIYTQTLNEKGIKVSKKFNVGDIVIAIVGATIGATTILQIDAYATDSIIAIKSTGKTNNVFLEMLLRFYRQVLLDTAPEAARANINLSILNKLKIITPPIELQNKYLEIDKRIDAETERLNNSLEQLRQLQNSLIQKVFNGQLNFNVDFELDSLIQEIDLQNKENDLSKITGDIAYLQRLVDKLNNQEFKEKDLYDKAKHGVFQLMEVKEEERKVIQEYDAISKRLKLALK